MNTNMTKSNPQTPQHVENQRLDARRSIRPRVDVLENEAEYLIIADVPGVTKDAIDVHFAHGELRLEAAEYVRAFAMPDGVDADKIDAELAHGVLRVHVPKSAAKRPRRIDIRAS